MDKDEVVVRGTNENLDDLDVKVVMGVPCLEGMKVGYVPYKNSSVKECSECGTKIWVGPEQTKIAKTGVEVLCMICCVKRYGLEEVQAGMRVLTDKKMGE